MGLKTSAQFLDAGLIGFNVGEESDELSGPRNIGSIELPLVRKHRRSDGRHTELRCASFGYDLVRRLRCNKRSVVGGHMNCDLGGDRNPGEFVKKAVTRMV